jgi:hypothetical protein
MNAVQYSIQCVQSVRTASKNKCLQAERPENEVPEIKKSVKSQAGETEGFH